MKLRPATDDGTNASAETHVGNYSASDNSGLHVPEQRVEADLFRALMEMFDSSHITYCVVGDSRTFPEVIASDVDIVVDPGALAEARRVIYRFAKKHGLEVVQVLQHEQSAFYYVVAWLDGEGRARFLKPDVCGDYFRDGRRLLSAGKLTWGRRRAVGEDGCDRGFYVAAAHKEFLYYLLKRIDKQSIDKKHGEHLSSQWGLAPDKARCELERFFPSGEAQLIERAASSGDWTTVRNTLPSLRTAIQRVGSFGVKERGYEVIRRLRRLARPTGLMVAFLGTDGAGKSAVIDRVLNDLLPAFRQTAYFHLRPNIGRRRDGRSPVSTPHGMPLRSPAISVIKLAYYGLQYSVGYLLHIRMLLVRSTLVGFDRYAHDAVVDPKRYRYGGPKWWAGLVAAMAPRPDILILLDAPASVTCARKGEVDEAEAARQRRAYRELVADLPYGLVIDAAQPLETVVSGVERHILGFLARRTRAREEV